MNRLVIACLALLVAALSGCASFTYNNEKFSSASAAYAAQKTRLESVKDNIAVVSPTIAGTLLVITPSKATIEAVGITRRGSPSQELVDYVAQITATDAEYMAKHIAASKAFASVEGRVSDYPLKEARKESGRYTAVMYLHMLSPAQVGWYLMKSNGDDPIQINSDATAEAGAPKINSLIRNAVAAYRATAK